MVGMVIPAECLLLEIEKLRTPNESYFKQTILEKYNSFLEQVNKLLDNNSKKSDM